MYFEHVLSRGLSVTYDTDTPSFSLVYKMQFKPSYLLGLHVNDLVGQSYVQTSALLIKRAHVPF